MVRIFRYPGTQNRVYYLSTRRIPKIYYCGYHPGIRVPTLANTTQLPVSYEYYSSTRIFIVYTLMPTHCDRYSRVQRTARNPSKPLSGGRIMKNDAGRLHLGRSRARVRVQLHLPVDEKSRNAHETPSRGQRAPHASTSSSFIRESERRRRG